MNWYIDVLKKYAQFDGRARRKEYWMFALINFVIEFAYCIFVGVVAAVMSHSDNPGMAALLFIPLWIYALAILVPALAVSVRRLHDTGKSGWFILLGFVPIVGGIIVLVFMCQDSQPGPNEYGPNPKGMQGYAQMPPPVPGY
jgi:uncharacterized membrane protein YhaH (DUF805 family)